MTPLQVIKRLEEIKLPQDAVEHQKALVKAVELVAAGGILAGMAKHSCPECERRKAENLRRVQAFRARQAKRIKLRAR